MILILILTLILILDGGADGLEVANSHQLRRAIRRVFPGDPDWLSKLDGIFTISGTR